MTNMLAELESQLVRLCGRARVDAQACAQTHVETCAWACVGQARRAPFFYFYVWFWKALAQAVISLTGTSIPARIDMPSAMPIRDSNPSAMPIQNWSPKAGRPVQVRVRARGSAREEARVQTRLVRLYHVASGSSRRGGPGEPRAAVEFWRARAAFRSTASY